MTWQMIHRLPRARVLLLTKPEDADIPKPPPGACGMTGPYWLSFSEKGQLQGLMVL